MDNFHGRNSTGQLLEKLKTQMTQASDTQWPGVMKGYPCCVLAEFEGIGTIPPKKARKKGATRCGEREARKRSFFGARRKQLGLKTKGHERSS